MQTSSPVFPQSEDRAFIRQKYWVLAKLCFALVMALTTWFSATAVMAQLKIHWQVSVPQAAWLAVAVQLGFVLGSVFSAITSLADLVPARLLMAGASIAVAVVNALLLVAQNGTQAVCLRVLTGVLLAGVYPPAVKFISTWFRQNRGIALGCVIGALTLGSATPHAVNALGGADWHFVILSTSAATLVAAALFLLTLSDGPFSFPKVKFRPSEVGTALSDRRFLLCTVGYVGHMWELYALWSWLLFFVSARLSALGRPDQSLASIITFAIIALGAPSCVAAGVIADKIGRPLTTVSLMAISGLCALLIGVVFPDAQWVFLAVGLVWGGSVIADSAQFSAIVTESGQRFVGTALTVQMGAGFAITVPAILALPYAAAWLDGWRWVFLVLVPGPLLGSLAMLVLHYRDRREPRRDQDPLDLVPSLTR